MRSQDSAGDDVALIVSAMFRVASDPQDWSPLLSALEAAEPLDAAPSAVMTGLSHSQDVALLSARQEESQASAPASWLLLSARGHVLSSSGPGSAFDMRGLGEVDRRGRLTLFDPDDQTVLEAALEHSGSAGRSSQILRLQGAPDRGPFFAYLVPAASVPGLPDLPPRPDLEGCSLLVFAPAGSADEMWPDLKDSFSLTPAEIRLAQSLGDGRSLSEAAERLGVSLATVRNQLRSIFDKVGVHRQSDLVRMLSDLSQVAGVLARGLPSPDPILEAPAIQHFRLPDGRRLAFREYGRRDGRPVLIFHEGLGSSLMPVGADGLARRLGLRVICPDRPGFGQSDPLPDHDMEGVAADLEGLCNHLGVGRLEIATIVSGTTPGLTTAIRLGERVGNLILVSARLPARGSRLGARDLVNRLRAQLESHPWVMETLFSVLRLRLSRRLVMTFMRRSSEGAPADLEFLEAHPETAAYVEAYFREALGLTARGAADEIRTVARSRNMTLEGLRARLHVWHGEDDAFAPVDDVLRFAGDRVDELRLFPKTGHLLPLREWPALMHHLAELASPPAA